MTILRLGNIRRNFGGLPAVDGVSFPVPAGQITGLIGPNGAGKTTVVNMITGLLRVTAGRIMLDERDITTTEAPELARAGLARTFQNIRLIPNATVLQNVMSGFHRHEKVGLLASLVGTPAVFRERRMLEEQAWALLKRFGMTDMARYPAGSLSYGHQRRIEMMRALATDPTVLLLDEPVAGMNDSEAHSLADIFRSVAEEGVAILLIEHNMRFVMSLCRHIHVLASGRLIAGGSPDEIAEDPVVIQAYLGG